MNLLKILIICYCIVLLYTTTYAKTSKKQDDLSFASLVQSAYKAPQGEAKALIDEAEQRTLQLDQQIAQTTEELKEQAEERYEQLQKKSHEEIESIKQKMQESIEQIEKNIEEQASEIRLSVKESENQLKIKASQEVLDLLDEADEKILEKRRIARRKHLTEHIVGNESLSLSPEWKNKTAKEFSSTISILKNIVLDGEDDQTSLEFAERFSSYQKWFDTTLSMTQSRYEKQYKEIIKRKKRIEDLGEMQEKADKILNNYKDKNDISDQKYKRLRLMILYDLNSAYHSKERQLYSDEVKEIVMNIITNPPESFDDILTPIEEEPKLVPIAVADKHKKENDKLSAENKQLQKQIEERKQFLLNAEINTNKLSKQLQESQEALSLTASKFADSQKKIIKLTRTIEELKNKEKELKKAEIEIKSLKKEIAKDKEKIMELEKQILEKALEQQKLRQELEKRKTQKKELKKLVELERSSHISGELELKRTQLNNEQTESQIKLLKEQIDIEKQEQARLHKKIKQNEEVKQELEAKKQEFSKLEAKLAKSQNQLEWYQEQQAQARTYQEEQHKIHQSLSEKLKTQENTLNNQQQELSSMKDELAKLMEDKSTTEQLLNQERKKHEQKHVTQEELIKNQQAESQEKIQSLETRINKIESEKQKLATGLSQAVETFSSIHKEQEQQIQKAHLTKEIATTTAQEAAMHIAEQEGKLMGIQQQIVSATEELTTFGENIKKEKEQLSNQTEQISSQFKKLEKQTKTISQDLARKLIGVEKATQSAEEILEQEKINLQINEQRNYDEQLEQKKILPKEKEFEVYGQTMDATENIKY